MDKIKFFPDDLNIRNKKIILRLDLNVPLKNKLITDDTRINLCLPFIKKLIEKKAKIIIISHLGRPKGIKDPALSLTPVEKSDSHRAQNWKIGRLRALWWSNPAVHFGRQ